MKTFQGDVRSGTIKASQPSSGSIQEGYHIFPLRIYYEDTDAGGIVYHPNYLAFAERARTEMLRCYGIPTSKILKEEGVAFAVRQCSIEYFSPAKLDDLLWVKTKILEAKGAKIVVEQNIGRSEDTILVHIHITLVTINEKGRPVRLPTSVRQAIGEELLSRSKD